MMRLVGSRPRRNAGRATEKTIDFKWRGGTVVISRLIVPSITRPAAYVMASMCQFGRYTSPGDTVSNTFVTKAPKSRASIKSTYRRRPSGLSLAIRARVGPQSGIVKFASSDLRLFIDVWRYGGLEVVQECPHRPRSTRYPPQRCWPALRAGPFALPS